MAKYIFVAGGVMSGIGKGVATASIGKILQSNNFKVTAVKIDPYINVDAGTMSLLEHGEIFVTKDGDQCDQDVGNYERFLDIELTKDNYMTTGRIYQSVINRERNLGYEGRCVEVVPDIPNEVIFRIKKAARISQADFVLIEIGGTAGEYQNMLFLEAARIMKLSYPKDVLFVLVSYLPIPKMIGEMKTKPTQYAVRTLNSAGIQPDIILARSIIPLDEARKRKISIFCNVAKEDVISAPDIDSIYEIPINFKKEGLDSRILNKFGIKLKKKRNLKDWRKWERFVKLIKNSKKKIKIAIIEKPFKSNTTALTDCYLSLVEAVKHAAWYWKRKPEIYWLSAEKYEKSSTELRELKKFDGIIIPGGFGKRGVEGKLKAIEFCRKNKIPFLGLCLGMQLAVIEFARNVCKIKKAHSVEFSKNSPNLVINVMPEQKVFLKDYNPPTTSEGPPSSRGGGRVEGGLESRLQSERAPKKYGGMSGTMRLGEYKCEIKPNTLSFKAYSGSGVSKNPQGYIFSSERHRHRYELNNAFKKELEARGMIMSGINPEKDLVEIIELKGHPFFVGTQFHPEFKSRPLKPHPLFKELIRTCSLRSQNLDSLRNKNI